MTMLEQNDSLILFLVGTFAISLIAFGLMLIIPAAQSPEGLPGMPIWLIAVWSPSIMAIIIALRSKTLGRLLQKVVSVQDVGWAWLIVLLAFGVLIVALFIHRQDAKWGELTPSLILLLIGFNVLLGPLGEELGWRGYLQPALQSRLGWLGATLVVAGVWAIWHAPLWLINSPQREIPFLIFCIHVVAYSFIMASALSISPHSLLPVILLHLIFNVSSGIVLVLDIADTAEWYTWSASGYVITAVIAVMAAWGTGLLQT